MTDQRPFPYEVLDADESNVQISIDLFKQYRLLDLFERVVPALFAGLLPAVQEAAPPGFFPLVRNIAGGLEVPAYDFILRLFMVQSAQEQYIFALGHLFRGHTSEFPGHLRRAIESAGIAYLSKSKPELGEIFISGDAKKLRNATATQTILPPGDPVTEDLLESMNFASSLTHNNFITFVSRAKHEISINDDKWTVQLALDLYGSADLGTYLRLALWMLRVMERVLRVLAASFDLDPNSEWFGELAELRQRLNQLYIELDQLVNPIQNQAKPTD